MKVNQNLILDPKLIQKHTFHLVDMSPLPLFTAWSLFLLAISLIDYFHADIYTSSLLISFICIFFIIIIWLIIVICESGNGDHTIAVSRGLRIGFILFMISEIMLFFSFFWAFFHTSLVPNVNLNFFWPPIDSEYINIETLPTTNTLLLLWSGIFVNYAKYTLTKTKTIISYTISWYFLTITILFGFAFLLCQSIEYTYGISFNWDGDIFGSLFFTITGFHGLHVLMGILGLIICWSRMLVTTIFVSKVRNHMKIYKLVVLHYFVIKHCFKIFFFKRIWKITKCYIRFEVNAIIKSYRNYFIKCNNFILSRYNSYISEWIINIVLAIFKIHIRQAIDEKFPIFRHKLTKKKYDKFHINLIIALMILLSSFWNLGWEITTSSFIIYINLLIAILYSQVLKIKKCKHAYFNILIPLSKLGSMWHINNSWSSIIYIKSTQKFIFKEHKTLYSINWYLQLNILYFLIKSIFYTKDNTSIIVQNLLNKKNKKNNIKNNNQKNNNNTNNTNNIIK